MFYLEYSSVVDIKSSIFFFLAINCFIPLVVTNVCNLYRCDHKIFFFVTQIPLNFSPITRVAIMPYFKGVSNEFTDVTLMWR